MITIIYYTANMENPDFEQKMRDNISTQAKGLPIISVSRKPIDFGHNICVGEQEVCYSNSYRQILIGLREAKTKFCIAAESDTLYPPDYFTFIPEKEDQVYRYTNLYVSFDRHIGFWKKPYVEAAQMCGREHWIKSIEKLIGKKDHWKPVKNNPPYIFDSRDDYSWEGENPVLTFKTRRGIGFKTGFFPGAVQEIPFWGTYKEVKEKYL